MKSIKLTLFAFLAALLFGEGTHAQMVGTDCFLMGINIEMGIHNDGYPGSAALPGFPTHWAGGPSRLCYVANKDLSDPWLPEYDGGFYMPGSPENRFGMEVDGATAWNSSAVGSSITSYGLSDYTVYGKCKSVSWSGLYSGIEIDITYIIDTTEESTYYRMAVELTNTNPTDKDNVYFYYSADPDNNQFWGGGFSTTNTIVSQPGPFCPKALVTATQTGPWDSYLGYGGIGDNIRVARGSFFVTDGSDVYDGTGPMIGTVGSTAFSDQAIAICHRDATLAAGETSAFEFIVVMSADAVEEALKAQYFLDYEEGPGSLALCVEEEVDTVEFECGGSVDLTIEGPELDSYTWTWTDEAGAEVGTGTEITITPGGTATYIVTGEPLAGCFVSDIVREIVVVGTGIGPDIDITDIGPQCGPVDIGDIPIADLSGLPGVIWEYYTVIPDSMDHPLDIWTGPTIFPGDEVYVMAGDPAGGCFDVELIEIDFIGISAGLDSTGYLLCNSGVENVDLDSFLVDTSYILAGSTWEEVVPTGGFDPVTNEFDPTGLPAGDYQFYHIALGGADCPNDTSIHTVTIENQSVAGDDNTGELCNTVGFTFDMNTLLSGHDPGGFWEEVDPTGGAFDPITGIFTADGTVAPGDYEFLYITLSTAPCINDTASMIFTLHPLPIVDAGPDQSICIGDETSVSGDGTPGVTYVWTSPAGIDDGVTFTPAVGTLTYNVTGTDANGCVNYDSLEIVVNPLPIIDFMPDSVAGCLPFEVEFSVESDVDIATTDWFYGDGGVFIGATDPTVSHTYLFDGLYDVRITVTDIFGCVSSLEYDDLITVEEQPVAEFRFDPQSVFTNNTEVTFSNESKFASDFLWNFGDGSPESIDNEPIHFFPDNPGDVFYAVQLTASNYLGCKDSVIKYIFVKEVINFHIPNAFTPDGDQFNETFQPVFESGFDPYDFHMTIYNRWGEVVFETFNAEIGWNGTYGNLGIVEDGVYIWHVEFGDAYNDQSYEYNGHVTILK